MAPKAKKRVTVKSAAGKTIAKKTAPVAQAAE